MLNKKPRFPDPVIFVSPVTFHPWVQKEKDILG